MKGLFWVCLLAAGCAAGPHPDLRIATGDSGEGLAPHRQLVAAFQASHPGLRLQLEPVSGGDYYTRLLTEMASGEPPDIVHLGDEALASFVRRQALEPLDPLQASLYLPGVLEPGAGYLIPKDFTPLVCYCNARLFREAGLALPGPNWSWEEFVTNSTNTCERTDLKTPSNGAPTTARRRDRGVSSTVAAPKAWCSMDRTATTPPSAWTLVCRWSCWPCAIHTQAKARVKCASA